jgi:hypothetical protein
VVGVRWQREGEKGEKARRTVNAVGQQWFGAVT